MIAGPNGAGKTTFAAQFLPNEADCPIFVNADLIAAGLSPLRMDLVAVRAGRVMLEEVHEHARNGNSFAFETTLSGRSYAHWIPRWQERGYRVKLFFLRLPTLDAAIRRVAQRVLEGGHDVPEPAIRRRFHAGWRNFQQLYRGLVDEWALYDNAERRSETAGRGDPTMISRNEKPVATPRDPDLVGAEAAMHRAARDARRRAEQAANPATQGNPGRNPASVSEHGLIRHSRKSWR